MHRWRVLTVAGAGALVFTGCCNCEDPGAMAAAAPGGTLVDVSWATTSGPPVPTADPATIVAAVGGAEIVRASTVPSATEPAPTTSVAPTVPPSTVPPSTSSAPPTTIVAVTAPLEAATATTALASPAPVPAVETADGCSMAAQDPFVGSIPMKRGDYGDHVLDVQVMLQQLGFDLGRSGLDGDYGPDSENAFEQYQFASGQPVTGIVCMEDWYALVEATGFSG